jgi:hypothetical protein
MWVDVLSRVDLFPKQKLDAAEFFRKTTTGGLITIVSALIMTLLFFSELGKLTLSSKVILKSHCSECFFSLPIQHLPLLPSFPFPSSQVPS